MPLLFLDGFRFISSSAVKPYFMGFLALFIYRLLLSEFVTFSKIGVKIGVVRKGISNPCRQTSISIPQFFFVCDFQCLVFRKADAQSDGS